MIRDWLKKWRDSERKRPFLDFLKERLDKRIEIAKHRKWSFISMAIIAVVMLLMAMFFN